MDISARKAKVLINIIYEMHTIGKTFYLLQKCSGLLVKHLCHDTNNDEPQHEISNNVICATSKASDKHAHTCCLIRAFASRLNIL